MPEPGNDEGDDYRPDRRPDAQPRRAQRVGLLPPADQQKQRAEGGHERRQQRAAVELIVKIRRQGILIEQTEVREEACAVGQIDEKPTHRSHGQNAQPHA